MQEYVPSLSPGDIRKIGRSYELAREHLGEEIDIIVHCHNELDTPSAIAVAEAVEAIKPIYYEDPLQPGFSENWLALRRATNIPIMTGENIELPEGALPFLQAPGGRLPAARHHQLGRHHRHQGDRRPRGALPHADHAAQCQRAADERGQPATGGVGVQLPAHRVHPAGGRPRNGRRPIRCRCGTARCRCRRRRGWGWSWTRTGSAGTGLPGSRTGTEAAPCGDARP
jgi:hypothetical protein